MGTHIILSSTADDQHISHRLPDLLLPVSSVATYGFKSFSLCPRRSLAVPKNRVRRTFAGPGLQTLVRTLIFILILLLTLASPLLPPAFPLASSWSFDLRPPYLAHPTPPSHPSALPTFLVLSPSFLALNSPSCPTLTVLAGLFSRPLHPHPSHFPHVRHPLSRPLSPRRPALSFWPPSSRLAHPCDLTLPTSPCPPGSSGAVVAFGYLPLPPHASLTQFSPSLPTLLTPSTPSSRPPHLHRPIAYANIKTLVHENCARVLQVT